MKLIHNKVLVDVGDDEHILLNSLNGKIDLLDKSSFEILKNWDACEKIEPSNANEKSLYSALFAGGYLVENAMVEQKQKQDILYSLRETHERKQKSFSTLTFVITYDCNFRCSYCYEAGNVKYNHQMTKEMVDAALGLTDADILTNVNLFGGEPLLLKNKDIVKYIFSRCEDKKIQITTNGYTLIEYIDLFEGHNFSQIQVTLDGPGNYHNQKRFLADGSPTYAKIMEGIEACLKRKIPIHIRMNIDNRNVEKCIDLRKELLEKWSSYDKLLSFEMYPLLQLEAETRQGVIEGLSEIDACKTSEELAQANATLATFRPIVNYFINGTPPYPLYAFCHAHGGSAFVDPLGDIYTCILSLGQKELSVGRYYPNIEWKDNSILTRNIGNITECKSCEYALFCGGGCPLGLDGGYDDVFRSACAGIKDEIHTQIPYFFKLKRSEL